MSNVPAKLTLAAALLLALSSAALAESVEPPPKPRTKPAQAVEAKAPPAPAGALQIITRAAWQAKPPLFKMDGHVPLSIVVHHTAVRANKKRDVAYKMRSLQAYSQKPAKLGNGRKRKAWADVPYHFYIGHDGAIAEGRDVKYSGDTNTNYDTTGHIQVVLEGNFERAEPTAAQMSGLEDLLVQIAKKWRIDASDIRSHKSLASTLCPGKHLQAALPTLQNRVAERLN